LLHADVLVNADPELKRTVYDELGVRLTYHLSGEVTSKRATRMY